MQITFVNIGDVKNNPNNPRLIKDDSFNLLVKSIKEFPKMLEIRPIVVNNDMVVLGGNQRLRACKEAGLKKIPIIKASGLDIYPSALNMKEQKVGAKGKLKAKTKTNSYTDFQIMELEVDVIDNFYSHE
jgi:ParB-like chromosome segregation protein Spo0J